MRGSCDESPAHDPAHSRGGLSRSNLKLQETIQEAAETILRFSSSNMTTGQHRHGASTGVYTQFFLRNFYDLAALRFNMTYLWRCPVDTVQLPLFRENFSDRHLDIGVATGYFPTAALRCEGQSQSDKHLTLMDLNPNSLKAAEDRVLSECAEVATTCVEADIKAPIPKTLQNAKFESISMFNLFHCVPGTDKVEAFGRVAQLLGDDGVLIGVTVLGVGHTLNWFTTLCLRFYNGLGVFNNWDDRKEVFDEALNKEFAEVETCVVGLMLVFRARKPRRP